MMNDLLDMFALRAMPIFLEEDMKKSIDKQKGPDWVAFHSYKMAYSMLKERNHVLEIEGYLNQDNGDLDE